MYLKLIISKLNIEFSTQDRTLSLFVFYENKTIINYERYFPKYFKCAICKEETEYEGEKLKLCEEHYDEYIRHIQKKAKLP